MDKKSDSILDSVQNLKKVQRLLVNKVIRLEDNFKGAFEKVEKRIEDKFTHYERKLNLLEEPIESLKVKHENTSDDVSRLEAELKHTKDLMVLIDKNLEDLDSKHQKT